MESRPFEDLMVWVQGLLSPGTLVELLVLAACAGMAWVLSATLRRALDNTDARSILFGRSVIDGVLFPLLWLCLAAMVRLAVLQWTPAGAFRLALPVLAALVVIRVGAKVLHRVFSDTPLVRMLERSISWIAWLSMVLWVSGLLPVLRDELDGIQWKMGGAVVSLRSVIEGTMIAGAALILSLWASAAIEARLLRNAQGGELSLRKALSNALRAALVLVALLVALSAVGFDLTALSVMGGAIGVGIGLGLQKLAANYVSGFVMLAERSVRIGDVVRVDGFEGRISDINARYSVVRAANGRESIVPNELFVTQRVENLSLTDPRVWQSAVVLVAYDSDPELVIRLLEESARRQSRVLADPPPQAALSAFGVDGLEFTLGWWTDDPQTGMLALRSDIHREVLSALRAQGVRLPPPQRAPEAVGQSS